MQRTAVVGGEPHPMRQEGLFLAQGRPHQEQSLEAADSRHRQTQPRRSFGYGVCGEIGLTQTMVDVVTAQAAGQSRHQMAFFEGAVGA